MLGTLMLVMTNLYNSLVIDYSKEPIELIALQVESLIMPLYYYSYL